MDVGAEIIVMFKINRKLSCKDSIRNLTKDCPGGSYLMLKIQYMLPRDRPLIDIGYKYSVCKVL